MLGIKSMPLEALSRKGSSIIGVWRDTDGKIFNVESSIEIVKQLLAHPPAKASAYDVKIKDTKGKMHVIHITYVEYVSASSRARSLCFPHELSVLLKDL